MTKRTMQDFIDSLPEGTTVLDASDPNFGRQLCDAMGLQPGDKVRVITPQFDREDGTTVLVPGDLDWKNIDKLSETTLKELGLRKWDEPDANGMVLWLFPAEWYDYIPDGVEVVTISNRREVFKRGETDDDRRYGMLAYGVVCPATPPAGGGDDVR
jgi:hypothetical protein